ncbi:LytTr DNA-binding domain protein [compost metagenome]
MHGKNFVRTQRSYIVNLQYIAEFQRRTIILKTGEMIPVGVTYEEKVKSTFLDYMIRNNTIF